MFKINSTDNLKTLFLALNLLFTGILVAQVGIGTTSPDSSSILDITSLKSGILIPRMNQEQRDDIIDPAEGLLLYQNDNNPGFYYYSGTIWIALNNLGGEFTSSSGVVQNTTDIANDDFVFGSTSLNNNVGTTDDSRFFFDKSRSAFRAGFASGVQWDNINIGDFSFASGEQTRASGINAVAMGRFSDAAGNRAIAMGNQASASNVSAIAIGDIAVASADNSISIGNQTTASAIAATAIGDRTEASGQAATAMGSTTNASGDFSIAIGRTTVASAISSIAIGRSSVAVANNAVAIGNRNTASGNAATATGSDTIASGDSSTSMVALLQVEIGL